MPLDRDYALTRPACGCVQPSTIPDWRASSGRTDMLDLEELVEQLNTIGYAAVDVVEMPGQYAVRGGLLMHILLKLIGRCALSFSGNEVESIRKFDPGTQRSASAVDEVVLLPLSETPVAKSC